MLLVQLLNCSAYCSGYPPGIISPFACLGISSSSVGFQLIQFIPAFSKYSFVSWYRKWKALSSAIAIGGKLSRFTVEFSQRHSVTVSGVARYTSLHTPWCGGDIDRHWRAGHSYSVYCLITLTTAKCFVFLCHSDMNSIKENIEIRMTRWRSQS